MIDPAAPDERLRVAISDYEPLERFSLATENYTELFGRFSFLLYFWNSTFITVMANADHALDQLHGRPFALSK